MVAVTIATPSSTATNAASASQRRRQTTPARSEVIADACRGAAPASAATATNQQSRERLEQDLHVEPGGPVLDVEIVPLDAILERGLASKAVDLCPAGEP